MVELQHHSKMSNERPQFDVTPVTPSGRSHKEIDRIVRKLASDYNISLPERHDSWSPSKARLNDPERCYSCIKYLYFGDRDALHRALDEFRQTVRNVDGEVPRLQSLLKSLQAEQWICRNSVQRQIEWTQKRKSSNEAQPDRGVSARSCDDVSKRYGDQAGRIYLLNGIESLQCDTAEADSSKSAPQSHSAQVACDMSNTEQMTNGEREEYRTPPQSPTPDQRSAEILPSLKRPSDDAFRDEIAFKQRKRFDYLHEVPVSRIDSASRCYGKKVGLQTYREPTVSASTSFSSTTNPSFASSAQSIVISSTAATSFMTEGNGAAQALSSSGSFSVDDETIHQHITRFETAKEPIPNPISSVSKLALNTVGEGQGPARDYKFKTPSPTKKESKPGLEHYQVRDLPEAGFFANCSSVNSQLPFHVCYECMRIALFNNIACSDLIQSLTGKCSSIDVLWESMSQYAKPPKCSASAWKAAEQNFQNVSLRAKVSYGETYDGPLFKLNPEPLQIEKSCRFQRKYGGSRFLFLEFPNFNESSMPPRFRDQRDKLQERFLQWLKIEKTFLGRKWIAFHYTTKTKRAFQKVKQEKLQRVVFFATDGYDIPPVSVDELLNWFMCLKNEKNQKLPYCKAYSRLDLGLSRTDPTVVFYPSQVRWINDIRADGTLESSVFDDTELSWPELYNAQSPHVMNDGCARISSAAAREIWTKLQKIGPVPSIFQARIGGCKGVWMCNASTSTRNDNEIWIEIASSQKKFEPHAEDRSDTTFDNHRLTFEVVNYSRSLSPDRLHIDFLPILQDRKVLFGSLARFVQEALEEEQKRLLEAIENPVELHRWVFQRSQLGENARRRGDYRWKCGLPSFLGDRITFMLQSGFDPRKSRFLADLVHQFVRSSYGDEIRHKFHIPVARSTSVMGVADPKGVLQPGEIHLSFSRGFNDESSGESYPCIDGREVLIARHPTLRRSDIQKVRAVYNSELSHLIDVVVFPSKGCFPLAAKLQGGDYDGDSFWLCWEPGLTASFRNAPPPVNASLPEDLGIAVDKRQVQEFTDGNFVLNYIHAGLDFKMNPDYLGISTSLHGKIAYHENTIDSPAVRILADLHDLLIDSAKNGYCFSHDNYQQLIKRLPGITMKSLGNPAYKKAMTSSTKDETFADCPELASECLNRKHVTDRIYFEVMSPHIKKTLNMLLEIRDDAPTYDPDLVRYFGQETMHEEDFIVRAELEELPRAIKSLYDRRWAVWRPQDSFKDLVDGCSREYDDLQPVKGDHAIVKFWTRRLLKGVPSHWELLKASCLFEMYHKKPQFAYNLAGKDLAYIKANFAQRAHTIAPELWANMKPRRGMRVASEDTQSLTYENAATELRTPNSDSGSEDEGFTTAPDTDDLFGFND